MKGLMHCVALGFPSEAMLVVFTQDMLGLDRWFATYKEGLLDEFVHYHDAHREGEYGSYDLFVRSPKIEQNRV
jgi:hypothetical protein